MLNEYRLELINFYNFIKANDDLTYLISILRVNVSPTSARLKLGTMVNISNSNRFLKDLWKENRHIISKKLGVDFLELREKEDSILVYFYDKRRLINKLRQININKFLYEFGYEFSDDYKTYLVKLKERFEEFDRCPNEIGIFLGYPINDVRDFNCNRCDCKFTGYWKCYNNVSSSLKAFRRYDIEKLRVINEIYSERVVTLATS